MIRPLRVRHRRTVSVLALLLPLGVFAALALRPAFPLSETSATELSGHSAAPAGDGASWRSLVVRDGVSWTVDVGPGWIEVGTDAPLPDVLAYLVAGEVTGDRLPDDALLLGSVAGLRPRRFALPPGVEPAEHTLVLYSLGHTAVVYTRGLP